MGTLHVASKPTLFYSFFLLLFLSLTHTHAHTLSPLNSLLSLLGNASLSFDETTMMPFRGCIAVGNDVSTSERKTSDPRDLTAAFRAKGSHTAETRSAADTAARVAVSLIFHGSRGYNLRQNCCTAISTI